MFAVLVRPLGRPAVTRYAVRYASKGSKKNIRSEQLAQDSPEPEPSEPPPAAAEGPVDPQKLPSLDISPLPAGRTSAKARTSSSDSAEEQRRYLRKVFLGLFGVGFIAWGASLGREWTEEELKERKLDAQGTGFQRTKTRFSEVFDIFSKPVWRELLPPPYPPPQGKPYTLLLEIDDLLVTSTWDRKYGWRTAKRPGVDYFLAYISQFYEVVVFTTQNSYTAQPVLEALDRYNFFITHRLFRESTKSTSTGIVKDLSYLNRDLSKVVVLETDPDAMKLHPENTLVIPKWKGDPKDSGLIAIIPFLESMAIFKTPDVRPILNAYKDKDVAIEWAKREEDLKARHIAEWTKKHPKRGGFIGWLFGEPTPPPTYLEQKRTEAQAQYKEEQAYIKKHKDYLEKLLDDERKAQERMVPSNLWEAIDYFQGKPKLPPAEDSGNVKVTTTDDATLPSTSSTMTTAK